MTREEMDARGWRELDVLLVTGDAYFDHPSSGVALIGRLLEKQGYRVGILSQPDWQSKDAFKTLGPPALFVGITAGAVDSVVNNYTASGAKRRKDVYAEGGRSGRRPDNATLVYAARAREAFPGVPIILGGVEASVRRFAYYDARKSKIRRSILVDSRADLLVYGSGEYAASEIAARLGSGADLAAIPGTARLVRGGSGVAPDAVELPAFDAVANAPDELLRQALAVESSGRPFFSRQMVQRYEEGIVLAEPPQEIEQGVFDSYFDLDFNGTAHPSYLEPIPALATVKGSVISHRGCPGGCSFCAIAMHQGRRVLPRSTDAVMEEVKRVIGRPDFRGTITDIGGPTANAYGATSNDRNACKKCKRPSCLYPKICKHLETSHEQLLTLLERVRGLPGVKHLYLASGIRHDLALEDDGFIPELAHHYTGGHLKTAPEHVSTGVLTLMRKPEIAVFEEFERRFKNESKAADLNQYIVPYIIAGFPGCTRARATAAKKWLASRRQSLEQVQMFMPLAGTVAAAMFAAGKDPRGSSLYVPDTKESRSQKDLLTSQRPESTKNKQRSRARRNRR